MTVEIHIAHSVAQIARQLRDARQTLGISQLELANSIGVSQSDVSRWECGTQGMTVESLLKVLGALGGNLAIVPKGTCEEGVDPSRVLQLVS